MQEIWKSIKLYNGNYLISNCGNVKSIDRYVQSRQHERFVKGLTLTKTITNSGKLCVTLSNGKSRSHSVDRLVAEAFIPNLSELPFIKHLDSNQLNCCADNLQWIKTKAKPHKPRKIKGSGRICPACGKRSFFERKSSENYFCGHCRHEGLLAPRANTLRMAGVRSDYSTGKWTYQELAEKYQISISTAWVWVKSAS